jgi:hypothetical protein
MDLEAASSAMRPLLFFCAPSPLDGPLYEAERRYFTFVARALPPKRSQRLRARCRSYSTSSRGAGLAACF